ncbi:hypothetical protein CU102_16605 [Phyllobacterium brassicacearum]|uniref:Uncharacterized protein n=1 Tax=Phyllobacterium brassicacearum TaxID=314235 RepID=A0A2P7BMY7_9HYPH|nr:hypothetical protein CU102_16605 [Phyllobacterium brassicacearum]
MFPFFSVLGRSAGDIVAAEARWRKSKMLRPLNMRSKQKRSVKRWSALSGIGNNSPTTRPASMLAIAG